MMKSKTIRRLLVAAVTLGALVIGTPSAQATTTGSVNFVGTATLGSGFGYPDPTGGTLTPPLFAPKTTTYSFNSSVACTDASAGKIQQAGAACSISVSGSVTGNCGKSTGTGGTGTFTDSSGNSYALSSVGWTTSAGGTLVVTGTATKGTQTGSLTGAVTAVPTVGSCAAGTATGFSVQGSAAVQVA